MQGGTTGTKDSATAFDAEPRPISSTVVRSSVYCAAYTSALERTDQSDYKANSAQSMGHLRSLAGISCRDNAVFSATYSGPSLHELCAVAHALAVTQDGMNQSAVCRQWPVLNGKSLPVSLVGNR
jgi:hypothetical protein